MQDKPLEKKSQSPLYQQLMARLKNDILAGVYPSGARIPSEQLLCETYGVSRVTVRKAMLDLVQEGLLVRRQGKGTFVADERIQRDPAANHQLFGSLPPERALRRHQGDQRRAGGGHAGGRRASGSGAGGQVVEICRLRLCDGEPVMLEFNRFPDRYAFLLDEALDGSLYDLLRQRGIVPTSAVHDISLGHATPMVSRHLGTAQGDALLLLNELVMDQHGQPLHSSRQWIRGDKYTFRI